MAWRARRAKSPDAIGPATDSREVGGHAATAIGGYGSWLARIAAPARRWKMQHLAPLAGLVSGNSRASWMDRHASPRRRLIRAEP